MILIDANVLIYAYNPSAERHAAAKRWLEQVMAGSMAVRMAWVTLLAFVRIMTSAQVFRRPLTPAEVVAIVDEWLEQPVVSVLEPGDRHWSILRRLLVDQQAAGPLSTDAFLAALAIEHGATLHTTDRDFSRFPGVAVVDPLQGSS